MLLRHQDALRVNWLCADVLRAGNNPVEEVRSLLHEVENTPLGKNVVDKGGVYSGMKAWGHTRQGVAMEFGLGHHQVTGALRGKQNKIVDAAGTLAKSTREAVEDAMEEEQEQQHLPVPSAVQAAATETVRRPVEDVSGNRTMVQSAGEPVASTRHISAEGTAGSLVAVPHTENSVKIWLTCITDRKLPLRMQPQAHSQGKRVGPREMRWPSTTRTTGVRLR